MVVLDPILCELYDSSGLLLQISEQQLFPVGQSLEDVGVHVPVIASRLNHSGPLDDGNLLAFHDVFGFAEPVEGFMRIVAAIICRYSRCTCWLAPEVVSMILIIILRMLWHTYETFCFVTMCVGFASLDIGAFTGFPLSNRC